MSQTILHLDSSASIRDSLSRQISAYIAEQLTSDNIIYRDLASTNLAPISEEHISAYYTRQHERSDKQKQLLGLSDELIAELKSAQQLIIGAPMYNFSVPAALKAWIDLICRVGETFVYTDNGPEGLVKIERVFIVLSTGGTPVGSPVDFASGYLKQVCRFMGVDINNVHIIDMAGSKQTPQLLIDSAKQQVNQIIAG